MVVLAGVNTLFNGELVGYAMNARMTRHLVIQALFRAAASKHPDEGLIAHSDQGSQFVHTITRIYCNNLA